MSSLKRVKQDSLKICCKETIDLLEERRKEATKKMHYAKRDEYLKYKASSWFHKLLYGFETHRFIESEFTDEVYNFYIRYPWHSHYESVSFEKTIERLQKLLNMANTGNSDIDICVEDYNLIEKHIAEKHNL